MTAVEDQGGKVIGGTYETIIEIKIRNKCNVYIPQISAKIPLPFFNLVT